MEQLDNPSSVVLTATPLETKTPSTDSFTTTTGESKSSKDVGTSNSSTSSVWPLDSICSDLLADLWATRWETRHGAASGLRELLSRFELTRESGKSNGQTKEQVTFLLSFIRDIKSRNSSYSIATFNPN
ncbi:unnamed protein product [Protopolystoma xenopodis]|uniref:Uncharacterized protein n=1 Tax=Protopolystoma xenopodis TaxID=117903 RepID=A0A448X2Q3_9PLAT|nr:unnamed protein product [Protopolystoma xenopodis]